MTKNEARNLVEDLDNWKPLFVTDMTRVLMLTHRERVYLRVQALFKPWQYYVSQQSGSEWRDVWTGEREDWCCGEQITLLRIADRIWRRENA